MPKNKAPHDYLVKNLNNLSEFLNDNGYSYILMAGKSGTCSRYIAGQRKEIELMLESFAKDHPQFLQILRNVVKKFENENHPEFHKTKTVITSETK